MSERVLHDGSELELPKKENDFFRYVIASAEKGEKRNIFEDSATFAGLKGITYDFLYDDPAVAYSCKPLLVVPKHHARPFLERRTPFSTGESMIDTALTNLSLSGTSNQNMVWAVKKFYGFDLTYNQLERKTQNATIICLGNIGVNENTFKDRARFFAKLSTPLKNGANLGFFAEVEDNTVLRKYFPLFRYLLRDLKKEKVDFSILPVSIYNPQRTHFVVHLGIPIDPQSESKVADLADKTMYAIADNLPEEIRGPYNSS